MKKKQKDNSLFFSRTNDFFNLHLPEQIIRSRHTIKTYCDGLTVFRRYIADHKNISMRKFTFADCTYDCLLDYSAYLKDSACAETTCNKGISLVCVSQ